MGILDRYRDWKEIDKEGNGGYEPEQPSNGYVLPSLRTLKTKEELSHNSKSKLINPLLIGVKMFLADLRIWRNEYIEGRYVCSNFTQKVVDEATKIGMRCGFVTISFKNSPIGHAIIVFETDYGTVFVEPQKGEQVEVIVGKYYPISLEGVSELDYISEVDIKWNDEAVY